MPTEPLDALFNWDPLHLSWTIHSLRLNERMVDLKMWEYGLRDPEFNINFNKAMASRETETVQFRAFYGRGL